MEDIGCKPQRTKVRITEVIEGHQDVIERHKRNIQCSIAIIRGSRDAIEHLRVERDMAIF